MVSGKTQKLMLHAKTHEQLAVIATMLQDSLVPPGDISFLENDQSFVMVLNRFRWETPVQSDTPYERVLAGLRFDAVKSVKFRGINRRKTGTFLSLLTIVYDNHQVVLHFGGERAIRLEVERLLCTVLDLGDPWPTHLKPQHELG